MVKIKKILAALLPDAENKELKGTVRAFNYKRPMSNKGWYKQFGGHKQSVQRQKNKRRK